MTEFLERQLALAAIALLAALGSIALGRDEPPGTEEPPAVAPEWSEAPAGVAGAERYGETTACGVELGPGVQGIVHPVLPCGARLVVARGDQQVDAAVVDQAPVDEGQEFALTEALAAELGVEGVETVRWRFSPGAR